MRVFQRAAIGRRRCRRVLSATTACWLSLFLLLPTFGTASAHTNSVGYESNGGGSFTIWYGSYHVGTNFTEGSLQLVGPSFSSTVAFTLLTAVKPAGLIDGQTNFYSNGTQLVGTNNGSAVATWQGANFTGITTAGVYTFTYIPIGVPTQDWAPLDNVILSSSFSISASDIGIVVMVSPAQAGAPLPGPSALQSATMSMGAFLSSIAPVNSIGGGSCAGDQGAANPQCFQDVQTGPGAAFAQERSPPPEAASAYAAIDRLAGGERAEPRRWRIWSSAYGGQSSTARGGTTLDARTAGLVTGLDYFHSRDTMIGFALGGGGTSFGLSSGFGGGSSDMFQAGVYGLHRLGAAYLSASAAYGWNRIATDRVEVNGDRLTADFSAYSLGGRAEAGYRVATPLAGVTPYAALQAQAVRTPAYSEVVVSGTGLFALNNTGTTAASVRTELGFWFDRSFMFDAGRSLTLRSRAAWAHDERGNGTVTAAFQQAPGISLVLNGVAQAPNAALLSAAAELQGAGRWSLLAQFDGEFSQTTRTYVGTGTARYRW